MKFSRVLFRSELRPARRQRAAADGRLSPMSEGISQADRPQALEAAGEPRDLFSKFDEIIAQREGLLASGVEDPFNLVMEKVLSPTRAICNGRDTILLGTYNYMGMTFDPAVIAAGKAPRYKHRSGTPARRA